jgi:hypothetical protein
VLDAFQRRVLFVGRRLFSHRDFGPSVFMPLFTPLFSWR